MQLLDGIYLIGSGAVGLSNPYDCHIYLLDTGDGLALIDSGCGLETERLLTNVAAHGFDPTRIRWLLLTHAHLDHAAGAAWLRRQIGLQVITSHAEARLVEEGTEDELGLTLARFAGGFPAELIYHHCPVDHRLSHGQEVVLGRSHLRAIEVAGHSVGSVCYLLERDGRRVLFSGDTVFYNGVLGLLNCPGSELHSYRSYLPRLDGLAVDALLPGHMLFVLAGGQSHIDKGLAGLRQSMVPSVISPLLV